VDVQRRSLFTFHFISAAALIRAIFSQFFFHHSYSSDRALFSPPSCGSVRQPSLHFVYSLSISSPHPLNTCRLKEHIPSKCCCPLVRLQSETAWKTVICNIIIICCQSIQTVETITYFFFVNMETFVPQSERRIYTEGLSTNCGRI
jgi:hypothetical protein